ncbi:hypothetical protein [Kitasatospora sp. NPDC051914]|uniref:hypothetical protein n=1 Tax=Kitasatospora sp. NPDC051914 TaxID=3154945 RepID=UPI003429026B
MNGSYKPGRTRGTALRPERADLLDGLAKNIAVISVDFMQYAESYYFYDGDDRTSLASQVDGALTLADLAAVSDDPAVRQSGNVLKAALEDLAAILDERFLRTAGTPRQTLTAYRLDHGQHAGSPT